MSDYASIMGGNAPDTLVGQTVGLDEVGQDWDAFYRIESADVFLDRDGTTGDSLVDASGNANPVTLDLGSGDDTITTGSGNDLITTGAGNDIVETGGGSNSVATGRGNDLVQGGNGSDTVSGGQGLDTIRGGAGNDSLFGGVGADSIRGDAGDDSLFGGSGNDSLYGQAGDDMLAGGSGADLLMGGAGDDMLSGGSGRDVFAFDNGFGQDVITDLRRGDQINLAADLNGTGIQSATDLVEMGMISGGTTASGTKFTLITIGDDTIRLERVDSDTFTSQITNWVHVG